MVLESSSGSRDWVSASWVVGMVIVDASTTVSAVLGSVVSEEIFARSRKDAWVVECEVVVEGVWEEQEVESGTTVATAASMVCLTGGGGICKPAGAEVEGCRVCVDEEQVVDVGVEVAASRDFFTGDGDCCTPGSSSGGRLKGIGDRVGEQ